MDKPSFERKPSDVIGAENVGTFAAFYSDYAKELNEVVNASLVDYCRNNSFTSEEYSAFQRGLATFWAFFNQCGAEVEVMRNAHQETEE